MLSGQRKCGIAAAMCLLFCAACMRQPTGTTTPTKARGKVLKVGALLPLSGKYKLYGESTLHGVECGAGVQRPCVSPVPVEIVAKDSGGEPDRAAAAVTELVQQHQVAAIIGPLLSRTVEAAAVRAQELKVPLISLSQRDGVAEIGDYVFRIGINAVSQVETLARYAVKERGWKRFAVVYPNNAYGQALRAAFAESVAAAGGSIVAEKSYGAEIANIIEARHEGGPEDATKPATPARPKPGTMSTSGEVVAPSAGSSEAPMPVIPRVRGADAVFIPDSYRNVVALLKNGGPDVFGGAVLLGVNRWNSSGLLEAGARVEGAVFVDAFYPQSGDATSQQFVRGFSEAYHMEPTVLEAQSYDAMRIIIRAAQDARSRAPERIRDALARTKNFHGVTGRMSFNAEGDAIKQLHLLTVRSGSIQEIEVPTRAISQSALGRSLRREPRGAPNEKYELGGPAVPAVPPREQPVRTERGKYDTDI